MRIACPACDAAYDVPDRLIGGGRRLRCARCAHDWLVEPPAAAAAAPPPPLPPPPAPPPAAPPALAAVALPEAPLPAPVVAAPPAAPAIRRAPQVIDPPLPRIAEAGGRPRAALAMAWVASLLVVGVALAAGWVMREDIAAAWPPAARLYALIDGARGR